MQKQKLKRNNNYTREKIEEWTARLRSVYNRDFWDGYYLGRTLGEWSERYGSQATRTKQYIGKVTNYFSKLQVAEILIETQELKREDSILIIGPTTGVYEDQVQEIRVELQPVEVAEKGIFCSIPVKETVRRGDKLYRWIEEIDEF